MTVLLGDDQFSILSGLIAGIEWEALKVTSIRSATNAQKAKKIMESEAVDILLDMITESAAILCGHQTKRASGDNPLARFHR